MRVNLDETHPLLKDSWFAKVQKTQQSDAKAQGNQKLSNWAHRQIISAALRDKLIARESWITWKTYKR